MTRNDETVERLTRIETSVGGLADTLKNFITTSARRFEAIENKQDVTGRMNWSAAAVIITSVTVIGGALTFLYGQPIVAAQETMSQEKRRTDERVESRFIRMEEHVQRQKDDLDRRLQLEMRLLIDTTNATIAQVTNRIDTVVGRVNSRDEEDRRELRELRGKISEFQLEAGKKDAKQN